MAERILCFQARVPVVVNQNTLIDLVKDLFIPFSFERSFRLSGAGITTDRCLLSVNQKLIAGDACSACDAIYDALQVPQHLSQAVERGRAEAVDLHWGIDNSPKSTIHKVYFEYPVKTLNNADAYNAPVLLHVAHKWDPNHPEQSVTTSYHLFPDLPEQQLLDRARALCRSRVFEMTSRVIRKVCELGKYSELQYIEAAEAANERKSFDLNLYGTSLRVADCREEILETAQSLSCSENKTSALLDKIGQLAAGHIAGGIHRDGKEFLTVYYGAEHWDADPDLASTAADTDSSGHDRHHWLTTSQPGDRYFDYCLWPYVPRKPVQGKLRASNLLFHSFEHAQIGPNAFETVALIQKRFGQTGSIWGVKHIEDRIGWEFYFYDYQRRERELSVSALQEAISPIVPSTLRISETHPYFMFSVDIDDALLSGERQLEDVHLYVGNPGSVVSSGIAYQVTNEQSRLENFYFFFDAQSDLHGVADKISSSIHFDDTQQDINSVLRPELRDCRTICIANKATCDTVYFSGVDVNQLIFALTWLQFPQGIRAFIEENRNSLDHLRFDVGFDYTTKDGAIEIIKSGYYGVF